MFKTHITISKWTGLPPEMRQVKVTKFFASNDPRRPLEHSELLASGMRKTLDGSFRHNGIGE